MLKREIGIYALGRYISMSAHKARRVIALIKGRSYIDTLIILGLMPYRASYPILKLVSSAATNASLILGSSRNNLIISRVEVHGGPTVKKFKPRARARGRNSLIKRPTCHITVVVKDIS
uniref:Large ribosomal subunit protein uL22c n=1 Tax=Allotropa virgata TaxID=176242 RepID=A0A221SQS0_9ERIC|nr:ribosomal protein L22 [Allotropa virgata]ASN78882.1 ribosomal protein L22 [Allotropa virgata]ASN78905.1 ribosomal protein L22 [Allotropa virgata]